MSTEALVDAVYCGPFEAELPDGTSISPGDSLKVPPHVLDSGHWRQDKALPKAKKADS